MEKTRFSPDRRFFSALLLGVSAALLSALLLTCLFSALLALGVPDGFLIFFSYATVVLASVAGGFVSGRKLKAKGLTIGLVSGGALFVLHLLCSLLFGELSLLCLTFLPAELIGSAIGGIGAVNLT